MRNRANLFLSQRAALRAQPVLLESIMEKAGSLTDNSNRSGHTYTLVKAAKKQSFQQGSKTAHLALWAPRVPAPFSALSSLYLIDLDATNTLLINPCDTESASAAYSQEC